MTKKQMPSRIILTGFMGTGKSTIGRKLAKKLRYAFYDTDSLIEATGKKTIHDIFESEGEESFREKEKSTLKNALKEKTGVISTGGGAILDKENRDWMKQKGMLISLTAQPDIILTRLMVCPTRPLLRTKEPMKRIKTLMDKREKLYNEASLTVDTSNHSADEIVDQILDEIEESL